MIISIASGKGGTGKTTVAVNLALSVKDAQYLDFDVEEPNASIFLKAEIEESEDVKVEIPKINYERCDFCGKCADFCVYNALAVVPSNVLVFPELCHSCRGCSLVCPRDAIDWRYRVIGRIEHGTAKDIDFYQGLLNIGEIQSLPVIRSLKQKIDKNKNVIIDAPPGTSCPVIETVSGSDYCILVAEPTPFGLHDLKLTVETLRHIGIPFGVIVNKDGIGDRKIDFYCQTEKIPIIARIPHDRDIAHLYSKGIPFVEELEDWKIKFREIYDTIEEEVEG